MESASKATACARTITCTVTPRGIALNFGKRTGNYRPWWKQIAVTVHGAKPAQMTIADHPNAGEVLIAAR